MELLLEDENYEVLSHEKLIEQYKESLAPILEKRKKLKLEIDKLQKFILNNKRKSKKKTAALERQQLLKAEDKTFEGIQGDLEYAIYWMRNGHKPGPNRGVDRRSVYQNTKPVDPILMQRYFRSSQSQFVWDVELKENVITPSEKIILDKAMAALTKRELEVLLLYKGKGHSQYEIAEMLKVTRGTIKTTLKRANKKVAQILLEIKKKEEEEDNEESSSD
ncbi:sigma-70 family RNA polymerase sigma factor [Niallia sp. 03190]|uniref:sigma-70 family RNA polymerase sigma factor n=1 Tax=Niallia sp. 03190 TaxID=3458061 RepID=UPI004043F516